ncbi:MAG: hypothetical protein FWE04_07850 [Oscillospiraceae bacterium]|nr:hypothetical protein [Oscillospiraceae bacterium]
MKLNSVDLCRIIVGLCRGVRFSQKIHSHLPTRRNAATNFGTTCPEVRRVWGDNPNKHFIKFPHGKFIKIASVYIHLHCLPFLSRIRDKNRYHEKRVIKKAL